MTFLDVCQLYLHTGRRPRNLCTLWAILTFIRTEDTGDFLRWCRAYTVPRLRYRSDRAKSTEKAEQKLRADKLLLRLLQELFYCGCLPPCEIGLWTCTRHASPRVKREDPPCWKLPASSSMQQAIAISKGKVDANRERLDPRWRILGCRVGLDRARCCASGSEKKFAGFTGEINVSVQHRERTCGRG